jgi:hypothetical protein
MEQLRARREREGFSYIQKIHMECSIMRYRNMQPLCQQSQARFYWGWVGGCCDRGGHFVESLLAAQQFAYVFME